MILALCDSPDVLKVMKLVKLVIMIIKIVVPIILMITGMITFIKTITDSNDSLPEALRIFTKKAIAAVILFLVPSIVSMIVNVAAPGTDFQKCLADANNETINAMYVAKMQQLIDEAKTTNSEADKVAAKKYLSNITDENLKKSYESQIENINSDVADDEYTGSLVSLNPNFINTLNNKTAFLDVAGHVWDIIVASKKYAYDQTTLKKVPIVNNDGNYLDCSSYVDTVLYYYGVIDSRTEQNITSDYKDGNIHLNENSYVISSVKYDNRNLFNYTSLKAGDILVRFGTNRTNNPAHTSVHHVNIISSINGNVYKAYDAGKAENWSGGAIELSSPANEWFLTNNFDESRIYTITDGNSYVNNSKFLLRVGELKQWYCSVLSNSDYCITNSPISGGGSSTSGGSGSSSGSSGTGTQQTPSGGSGTQQTPSGGSGTQQTPSDGSGIQQSTPSGGSGTQQTTSGTSSTQTLTPLSVSNAAVSTVAAQLTTYLKNNRFTINASVPKSIPYKTAICDSSSYISYVLYLHGNSSFAGSQKTIRYLYQNNIGYSEQTYNAGQSVMDIVKAGDIVIKYNPSTGSGTAFVIQSVSNKGAFVYTCDSQSAGNFSRNASSELTGDALNTKIIRTDGTLPSKSPIVGGSGPVRVDALR